MIFQIAFKTRILKIMRNRITNSLLFVLTLVAVDFEKKVWTYSDAERSGSGVISSRLTAGGVTVLCP